MAYSVGEINAVCAQVKKGLFALIDAKGGMFSGEIEDQISDAELLVIVSAVLTALAAVSSKQAGPLSSDAPK